MANFNLSIELTKLFGANRVTTKSGQEVIVIPLDSNPITIGKNGAAYLSLEAKEKKQVDQWGGTHYIKPKYKKDDYANLSDEQKQNIPFVGTCYIQQNNYPSNGGGYNNATSFSQQKVDIDDSIF
jgi:hypothetical protein